MESRTALLVEPVGVFQNEAQLMNRFANVLRAILEPMPNASLDHASLKEWDVVTAAKLGWLNLLALVMRSSNLI
jgi:hypothetical protein